MAYAVQRRWPRIRVTVPVVVEVLERGGLWAAATVAGSTRDVSAGGVYVVSQEPPAVGARVRVDLSRPGRCQQTGGSVVRPEPWGFAVQFDQAVPWVDPAPPAGA